MIDLHQGLTGEELREVKPGLGGLALAQMDVWSTLLRGNFSGAARKQAATWVLLGRTLVQVATSGLRKVRST